MAFTLSEGEAEKRKYSLIDAAIEDEQHSEFPQNKSVSDIAFGFAFEQCNASLIPEDRDSNMLIVPDTTSVVASQSYLSQIRFEQIVC